MAIPVRWVTGNLMAAPSGSPLQTGQSASGQTLPKPIAQLMSAMGR